LRIPPIATNLIGSFPLANEPENFKRAIDDQVESGLDYISFPQLADMNAMFLRPLVDGNTVRQEGQKFIVGSEFNPTVTEEVRQWARNAYEYLRRKPASPPLRSCVTGPFTLASTLEVEGVQSKPFPMGYAELMTEYPWVMEKLTNYVRKVARAYSEVSALVSIDEPFLSILIGKRNNLLELSMSRAEGLDFVMENLDRAFRGITTIPAVHVCGAISQGLSEILLESEAKVLSHEFSEMERNFDSYAPEAIESYSKVLCAGVVSTKPTKDPGGVEPIALVEKRMENALNRYGKENLMFSPDCGFRSLGDMLGEEEGYRLALAKINAMVEARRNVGLRLGILTEERT